MTKVDTKARTDLDRPSLAEIEVTPAMLAAGERAFIAWIDKDSDHGSVVYVPSSEALASLSAAIFAAMFSRSALSLASRPDSSMKT